MKVHLIIDLGNSETRSTLKYRPVAGGITTEKTWIDSNNFCPYYRDDSPQIPEGYTSDKSTIFNITGAQLWSTGSEAPKACGGTFVNGELVEKGEFNEVPLKPSNSERKYSSVPTVLAFCNSVIASIKILLVDCPDRVRSEGVIWDVTFLMPPQDVTRAQMLLPKTIQSIKIIDCFFPALGKIVMTYGNINFLREGFCAYVGTVFTRNGKPRKKYMPCLSSKVLFVDIGNGTTDLGVIDSNRVVSNSLNTISVGGSDIVSKVRTRLREEMNCDYKYATVERSCLTGYIKDGAKEVPIGNFINVACKEVSDRIIAEIKDYFSEKEIQPREIEFLLTTGGGSVSASFEGCEPIGSHLLSYLKSMSPNISELAIPHDVNDEGEEYEVNPRLLNIIGASTITKLEE